MGKRAGITESTLLGIQRGETFGNNQRIRRATSNAFKVLSEPFAQVRVTGHFDDPAAQTCRETNQPDAQSLAPVAVMIERCRGTFVVTQVMPLQP